MNKEELAQLKELAIEARPGPWRIRYYEPQWGKKLSGYWIEGISEYSGDDKWIPYHVNVCRMLINKRPHPSRTPSKQEILDSNEITAQFIAAANPTVVLELIAEIERLEKEADWLAGAAAEISPDHGVEEEIAYWRKAAREAVEKGQ